MYKKYQNNNSHSNFQKCYETHSFRYLEDNKEQICRARGESGATHSAKEKDAKDLLECTEIILLTQFCDELTSKGFLLKMMYSVQCS